MYIGSCNKSFALSTTRLDKGNISRIYQQHFHIPRSLPHTLLCVDIVSSVCLAQHTRMDTDPAVYASLFARRLLILRN